MLKWPWRRSTEDTVPGYQVTLQGLHMWDETVDSDRKHRDFAQFQARLLNFIDPCIDRVEFDALSDFDWAGQGDVFTVTCTMRCAPGDVIVKALAYLDRAEPPLTFIDVHVRPVRLITGVVG